MADPRTNSAAAEAELRQMATMKANGETMRNIAAVVGKSPASVCRNLKSAEAKEIIERESQRLLSALPDITASSIQQIETSRKIHAAIAGATVDGETIQPPSMFIEVDKEGNETVNLKALIDYAGMAGKRETDILKALGILASPVQSIVVQNIYNDNRKATLTPEVLKALTNSQPHGEIEEAEIIGGEDDQEISHG